MVSNVKVANHFFFLYTDWRKNDREFQMKKRIIGLDILRDIGVIFIFLYHFCIEYINLANGTDPIMPSVNYFANIWARPASLFLFIISGYALMYNHENEIPVKDYYLRRFKGLFIPFYIAYTMMFLAYFAVNNVAAGSTSPLYFFVFTILGVDAMVQEMTGGLGFYLIGEWFMSCIVICYVVFPLFAKLIKRFKYLVLAILIAWSAFLLFGCNIFPIQVEHNPLFVLLYFYVGMLLYDLVGRKQISQNIRIICTVISVVIFVFLLLAGYTAIFSVVLNQPFEIICAIWSIAMFIAIRDVDINPEKKFYRVITYISGISWNIILVHHMIIILLFKHYDISLYSRRETFTLSILSFALTWVAAIVVRNLSRIVRNALYG